ncbi:sigma-54 interaction domain-containing protein [Geomicrobium sp. JSM 1781026]|uniref:sigma-54 interaction domain-containing protein n=1 Tax=unclassified Geomicrobium TaxID=2628951 RepID=UPI0026D2B15E|nr:sigma 54-interacting transcriptional regulator [Geomicrobium sp. JCM 19037]
MKLSAHMLGQFIDLLETGVHIVDRDGVTHYYNKKMAEIEGHQKEEVVHKPIQDVFTFADPDNSTLLQAIQEQQGSSRIKQSYVNRYGREITTINQTALLIENDRVQGAVEIARDVTRLEEFIRHNTNKHNGTYTFDHLIGDSKAMITVIDETKRATRTSSSVLLYGETGTGKELFAESIHSGSNRSDKPYITQNCAAIPEQLLESILFGTANGAFTGAKDKPGLFEQAHGGTLLLDEINSLPLALQAKLLRVLQDKTVRRVGGTRDVVVDVRIIASMNEEPDEAIENGVMRKDLYYRLNVVAIRVPPLRERSGDIDLLVHAFVHKFNQRFKMHVQSVDPKLLTILLEHDFPGNVRELEHLIEGAMNVIDEDEKVLTIDHMPNYFAQRFRQHAIREPAELFDEYMKRCESQFLQEALQAYRGNITKTAEAIGMSRQNLQYRLKKIKQKRDKRS